MNESTAEQPKEISGGNFLPGCAEVTSLDALFTQTMNTHDLFQNSNLILPYNRL